MSRAVFHCPFSFRVVSEAPSGSQLVPISGSGTRTGVQRPTVGFQTRVRFRTLAFSILSSQSGTLPFEDFSILLEEIAFGSFSGLIVIPPVSTWSRARNSGVRAPPPLRSRQSPMGIQGLSPKLLEQVRQHTEALELCVMALDVWCKSVPSRPFFFVAPEDRGGQQKHGPASIWQLAEAIAIVRRTREVTRSSAFACELRATDSPRPLAFTSNLSFLSSRLVQGWPQLRLKADFLQYSGPLSRCCSCGKNHRVLRGLAHRGQFATQVLPVFPVSFWSAVLQATDKTLRDGVTSQKGSFQECGEGANEIHGYSSSPWVPNLSSSPDSLMDSFEKTMGASLPALAGASSHTPASRRLFLLELPV